MFALDPHCEPRSRRPRCREYRHLKPHLLERLAFVSSNGWCMDGTYPSSRWKVALLCLTSCMLHVGHCVLLTLQFPGALCCARPKSESNEKRWTERREQRKRRKSERKGKERWGLQQQHPHRAFYTTAGSSDAKSSLMPCPSSLTLFDALVNHPVR